MVYSKENFNKKLCYILIMIILILNSIPVFAKPIAAPKNVLLLQSYNKGHNWTDGQNTGIIDELKASKLDVNIYVEYMDWKRYPTEQNLQQLSQMYKNKYTDKKIDLIITTDDAALTFALSHRKEFFSDAPIVFSGVLKSSADILLKDKKAVTGVYEAMDPENTVKEALKLFPQTKDFYVINDKSESGIMTGKIMMEAIEKEAKGVNAIALSDYSFSDLMDKASQLNKSSLVLFASYNSDISGPTFSTEEYTEMLTARSAAPVFTIDEAILGYGVIGGSVLSAQLQGNKSGEIAVRVLNGVDVNNIPIVNEKTVYSGYDYKVLNKFGVAISSLPKDSKIINRPFSFYENYKNLVYSVAIAFFVLILLISILVRSIVVRKKIEKKLRNNNEELSALYEEIYSTDESLQENLKELMIKQEELRISEEKYRMVAEATKDIIWELDAETKKMTFSNRIELILGYSSNEITTLDKWSKLVEKCDLNVLIESVKNAEVDKLDTRSCEYRIKTKYGKVKWIYSNSKCIYNDAGKLVKLVGAFTDITEIREQQSKINNLAYYDLVTGLPNRVLFNETAKNKIKKYEILREGFALFFIDLDNFKLVNDSFGHYVGDKLLNEVGKRLKELEYGDGRAFRLGGDEFIFLLNLTEQNKAIEEYSKRILKSLSRPYFITTNMFHVTASIGIALFPEDGITYDELLKNVDTAMYKSKDVGRGTYTFFNRAMGSDAVEKINIQSDLHKALDNEEFILHYQPLMEVDSMKIKGFEALIRWNHPKNGFISPDKFISVAEDTGMIIPIGKWVMQKACQYAKELYDLGYRNFYISVNVSTIQLVQKDFIQIVTDILKKIKLPANYLVIEITESVLMGSFEIMINKLRKLRNMGIQIALDDFGCGYSSLTYLKQLPISVLKIDKSFIEDIESAEDENSLTGSIIILAKHIGLKVIAEGVEQGGQLDYLKKHSCQMFQGYYASKPVPEQAALKLMDKFNGEHLDIRNLSQVFKLEI